MSSKYIEDGAMATVVDLLGAGYRRLTPKSSIWVKDNGLTGKKKVILDRLKQNKIGQVFRNN